MPNHRLVIFVPLDSHAERLKPPVTLSQLFERTNCNCNRLGSRELYTQRSKGNTKVLQGLKCLEVELGFRCFTDVRCHTSNTFPKTLFAFDAPAISLCSCCGGVGPGNEKHCLNRQQEIHVRRMLLVPLLQFCCQKMQMVSQWSYNPRENIPRQRQTRFQKRLAS